MKRIALCLVWIGCLGLALATRVEPEARGEWREFRGAQICDVLGLQGRIYVEWYKPENERNGTICCIQPDRKDASSFSDCEVIVSDRGPRSDGL